MMKTKNHKSFSCAACIVDWTLWLWVKANNVLTVKRLTELKLIGPLYFIDILYSWPKGEHPVIILVKGTLAVMAVLEIKIKMEQLFCHRTNETT